MKNKNIILNEIESHRYAIKKLVYELIKQESKKIMDVYPDFLNFSIKAGWLCFETNKGLVTMMNVDCNKYPKAYKFFKSIYNIDDMTWILKEFNSCDFKK